MPNKIMLFKDDSGYLSNFYPCFIVLDGTQYPSVEHAFQAAKAKIGDKHTYIDFSGKKITMLARDYIGSARTPGEAKRRGKNIKLRLGWEDMKLGVMEGLVRQKFSNDWYLAERLLKTGDAELIEGNWWGDTFWGVCMGKGENNLGKILMKVRGELKGGQQ